MEGVFEKFLQEEYTKSMILGAKVFKMHILNLTSEEIATYTGLSIEEVKEIINEIESERFSY